MKRLCKKLTAAVLAAAMMTCAAPASFGGMRLFEPAVTANAAEGTAGLVIQDNVVTDGKNCTGDVVIPEGVTAVAGGAFENNDKLTGITFPSTCQTLGGEALYHCPNLEKVTFLNPETVIVHADMEPAYLESNEKFKVTYPDKWTITNNKAEYDRTQDPETAQMYWIEKGYDPVPDIDPFYTVHTKYGSVFYGTIYGEPGSTAEEFAKDYCNFESLDGSTSVPYEMCGTCGRDVKWYLDKMTGTLTIAGTGEIADNPPFTRFSEIIKNVEIEDGVTEIGVYAFSGCTGLSITIPSSVINISRWAFSNCRVSTIKGYSPSYAEYYADEKDIPFEKIGEIEQAAGTCGENLTWTFDTATGTLKIEGTGKLNSSPWQGFGHAIKSIILEEGVTYIGHRAFYTCTALNDITIPASVTAVSYESIIYENKITNNRITIKGYTYSYADDLASELGCKFESIGELELPVTGKCGENLVWNFNKETETLTISGKGKMENWDWSTPWLDFRSHIKNVIIEDGVTSVGSSAFYCYYALTNVTIPGSVKSLYADAFYGCENLKDISLPRGVTLIGSRAFSRSGLTEIVLPDSITSIGRQAFFRCTGLTSITIPESVTSIGEDAFSSLEGGWKIEGLTIKGYTGSYAEKYAKQYKIEFEALDAEPLWGDVNCDSSVDIADAVLICRFAVADAEAEITDQGKKQADVNHDGTVDAKDSEKLVQYIAKKLTADDLKA